MAVPEGAAESPLVEAAKIYEGSGKRTKSLIEDQFKRVERRLLLETLYPYAGLIAGLLVVFVFLWVAYKLVVEGNATAGTIIASIDIASLAGVFVLGQRAEKKQ